MIATKPKAFKSPDKLPQLTKVVDIFESALTELFFINNPDIKNDVEKSKEPLYEFLSNPQIKPIWIYYPWNQIGIKTVPEDVYFTLRTARNHDIITKREQTSFRRKTVGIAGLSVGSSVVSSLVMSGGPKELKIADFDDVQITNLNRMRASLLDVNVPKIYVIAWQICTHPCRH